jgi:AcrR family transcriptional regulator
VGKSAERQERAESRGAATTERIIMAAERLFGTYGIEAVSMRQIIVQAGVGNNSAIAYHFGDRANLVREIWRQRLPGLELTRADMLRKVIDAGQGDDPHALARVLVMPAYDLVDDEGRHSYAAFLRQALRWEPGRVLRAEAMDLSPSSATTYAMFHRLFSHLPDDLFHWRSLAATGLFFDLVFDRDRDIAAGLPVMNEPVFLDEAIKMFIGCCYASSQ